MPRASTMLHASEVFQNVFGSAPVLSSERRAWPAVTVCLWRTGWLGAYEVPASDDLTVACHTGGARSARTLLGGGWSKRCSAPGLLHVIPPDRPTAWNIGGELRFSSVHLPRSRLAGSGRSRTAPPFRFAFRDPFVAGCLDTLVRELRQPRESGSLYVDSVTEALILHLLPLPWDECPPAPGRAALARACELIEACTQGGVGLDELAAEAGLSRSHFLRCFKAATGLSPHRFLLARRIERAQQMLLRSELRLAEIALRAGFSTQSHFTEAFRTLTGTTPARFRRAARAAKADF